MMASGAASGTVRRVASQTKRLPTREKVFLCNWYVKLVRPGKELPSDQVQCHVPMKMNKFDIHNYFEKIYGVNVAKVNTRIQIGKQKRVAANRMKKEADVKVAYITLADQTFEFPVLFNQSRGSS